MEALTGYYLIEAADLDGAVAIAAQIPAAWAELPPTPRWHAVRAELLARGGRHPEAVQALTASLDGPATDPERRWRSQRLAEPRKLT